MGKIIYHYCDANALQSIIESKKLWMTGHTFLNDETEFKEGYECLIVAVDSFKKSIHHRENQKKAIEVILKQVSEALVFSCSFSDDGDLLSQWRSYCPAEGGFSIGFDEDVLLKGICEGSNKNVRKLEKCMYEEKGKNQAAEVIARDKLLNIAVNFDTKTKNVIYETISEFLFYCYKCKHIKFSTEQEYRLFTCCANDLYSRQIVDERDSSTVNYFSVEDIKFRISNNVLIPYVFQTIPVEAIKEIYIGPSVVNSKIVEESLKLFLIKLGLYKKIKLTPSKVPS